MQFFTSDKVQSLVAEAEGVSIKLVQQEQAQKARIFEIF